MLQVLQVENVAGSSMWSSELKVYSPDSEKTNVSHVWPAALPVPCPPAAMPAPSPL